MRGEKVFKPGTILTNGKIFVCLTYRSDVTWTPVNNYGRKWCEYWGCRSWPKQQGRCGYVGDILVFHQEGTIPGQWLQKGEELSRGFIEIKRSLIKKEIADYLTK